MAEALSALLLVVTAAAPIPQLSGPAPAVRAAEAVLAHGKLGVKGHVAVRAAGRVSGAGYHAAEATLTIADRRWAAFGFGDSAADATLDASRRAARMAASELRVAARPTSPPILDPQGGTLVRLEGLRTFAALDATLEFLRGRDSTAVIAMIDGGAPTIRLAKTRSTAGVAAAARGFAPPAHVLKVTRLDGATVVLGYEPPPPSPPASPAGPTVDVEDAPR